MTDISEKLIPLGLTDKEARVYVALLQLGRSSAYGIATKADLKKPTTYVILGQLIEKGLVADIPRRKKQLFAPRPPETFFAQAEAKLAEARKVLPELNSLYRKLDADKARTMYFEGLSGMRQALWYREKELKGVEILAFFSGGRKIEPKLMDLYEERNQFLTDQKIKVKGFVQYDSGDKNLLNLIKKHMDFRDMKFLPPNLYNANVSIDTAKSFVRIQLTSVGQAVIIESEDFAKMFRQVFDMAWKYVPSLDVEEELKKLRTK